ncbi:S24 family peptidase [Bacillus sp. FJAT-18017]|uniref:S24 family peptidase n=1 Tax=Bacillus sp. FJAT-18017 TaxID=1705566 RepID=UPI0006B0694E|nr:S24 family peptidase [Bacillus sp. FJAT-18017]
MSEFNKEEFGQLLSKAKGDRSINAFAKESGVDSAHISRLIRGVVDSPPTPQTIKKLTDHAEGNVTYNELMLAAGHQDESAISLSDIANQLGIGVETVRSGSGKTGTMLRGNPEIFEDMVKQYLEIHGIRIDEVREDRVKDPDFIIPTPPYGPTYAREDFAKIESVLSVPVLGYIAAGQPIFAQEHIESYTMIPNPGHYKDGEIFILIVKGDSMEGSRIYEGDRVVVKVQPEVENGEIAVVNVNGDEATLKKVKRYEDGSVWLISTNEKYAPIPLNDRKARIVGKVIQVIFVP